MGLEQSSGVVPVQDLGEGVSISHAEHLVTFEPKGNCLGVGTLHPYIKFGRLCILYIWCCGVGCDMVSLDDGLPHRCMAGQDTDTGLQQQEKPGSTSPSLFGRYGFVQHHLLKDRSTFAGACIRKRYRKATKACLVANKGWVFVANTHPTCSKGTPCFSLQGWGLYGRNGGQTGQQEGVFRCVQTGDWLPVTGYSFNQHPM